MSKLAVMARLPDASVTTVSQRSLRSAMSLKDNGLEDVVLDARSLGIENATAKATQVRKRRRAFLSHFRSLFTRFARLWLMWRRKARCT